MRFSILWLFGLVAAVAVGFAALANPSNLWVGLIASTALFLLGVALLGVLVLRDRARASCCGFALFGLGYQLLMYGQVPLLGTNQDLLLPHVLTDWLNSMLYPGDPKWSFSACAHWLWVIALAAVGGLIGSHFYARRERASGNATANEAQTNVR